MENEEIITAGENAEEATTEATTEATLEETTEVVILKSPVNKNVKELVYT